MEYHYGQTFGSSDCSCADAGFSVLRYADQDGGAWLGCAEGYYLSAVAWSPDGRSIAFVADSAGFESKIGPHGTGVWIVTLCKAGQMVRLKHLYRPRSTQSFPSGVFWLNDSRIGWAAPVGSIPKHLFTFMQMGLRNTRPKRLVNQSFFGIQPDETGDEEPGAPTDVYYDRSSRTLLVTAELLTDGVCLRLLSLSTGRIRRVAVPHPQTRVYAKGDVGYADVCGALRNPRKPKFYIAAQVYSQSQP